MATEIKTWQIVNSKLVPVESTLVEEGKSEAYDLESWIADNPSILGSDITIIGRQVYTLSGPLDLLGIDRSGNTVIIELKRDRLPREALAQAVDYASDIASWTIDKIGEECAKYTDSSLEDMFSENYPDVNMEEIGVNGTQRIILVGFSIESPLERMINWLADTYDVNINALVIKYAKTSSGDEMLIKTSIISEEVEQQKIRKKRSLNVTLSNEAGDYELGDLKSHLTKYFSKKGHWSAMRIRKALIPACLEHGTVTRDILKEKFVKEGLADNEGQAGQFISLISYQLGMKKYDYLRQVIGYEYPNNAWEKDNYKLIPEYVDLIKEVINNIEDW